MNYKISINLSKIEGAFISEIKGETCTKKCICIPLENDCLFEGKNGVYLSAVAINKSDNYGNSHCVKPDMPFEKYKTLTKEEQNAISFVGNMKELVKGANTPPPQPKLEPNPNFENKSQNDDLPF